MFKSPRLRSTIFQQTRVARIAGAILLIVAAVTTCLALSSGWNREAALLPLLFVGCSSIRIGSRYGILCQLIASIAVALWLPGPITLPSGLVLALTTLTGSLLAITLARQQRQTLARNNAMRFEGIVRTVNDSLWDWNRDTGKVWRGGKVQELFGVELSDVEPNIEWWLNQIHPEDRERVWSGLQQAMAGTADDWRDEYRLRWQGQHCKAVSDSGVLARDIRGRCYRVTGAMVDVSLERTTTDLPKNRAGRDLLTGLVNREHFLAELKTSLDRKQETKAGVPQKMAVLFVDLDRFKVVNDSFGHSVGDELLTLFAARLSRQRAGSGCVARFGGDQFTILIEGVNTSRQALEAADAIGQSLVVPFAVGNQQIKLSASIGVAVDDDGLDRPEEILRRADLAMYRAKANGRARSQLFEPVFDTHARYLLQREAELRQSFHDGSLRLYYQPIVSLRTAMLVSFEALLRWHHPMLGLLPPSEILPVADEAGLSFQLGRWVLNESCRQLRRWRDRYSHAASLSISSNLSGKELMRPTLLEEITRLLSENNLEGSALLIELTETTIMEGDDVAIRTLSQIRDLGVNLALDDFGKGHSSLQRLQDFPITTLKVDNTFVDQVGGPKQKILDAIMALAHELKIEVTAEGIETPEQLLYLFQCGASRGQGLLFGEPLSEEAAGKLLKDKERWAPLKQLLNCASQTTASM